eukprot:XP_017951148.1 PREDICTED: uncharacterized protein LOC108648086 [Xenopus tropicalis]
MGYGRSGILLIALFVSVQGSVTDKLKFDEALLTVSNYLTEPILLLYVSDYCYQCLPQPLLTLPSGPGTQPVNSSIIVSSRYALSVQVVSNSGNMTPLCSWEHLYEEHGHYLISVHYLLSEQNTRRVLCQETVTRPPTNCYFPLLVAFVILVGVCGLYHLSVYISRLACFRRLQQYLCKRLSFFSKHVETSEDNCGEQSKVPESRRLYSLDTFRG